MLKEFKEFIAQGNVMDMAVGIIIGAAFTAIVSSLVGDIINPIIGIVTGGTDFSSHYLVLKGEVPHGTSLDVARELPEVAVFAWGAFVTAVINFLIIAFVVFMLVRTVNQIRRATTHPAEEAPAEPASPTQEELLAEIRDLLAARKEV